MPEQLNTTASFDENGKPINVEPGSALLAVDANGECLVEQADPGVNFGSAGCPSRCNTCGTSGFVRDGVYHSTIAPGDEAAPFCGRYQGQAIALELSSRPQPEQAASAMDEEDLRAIARLSGLGNVEFVPRERFNLDAAA